MTVLTKANLWILLKKLLIILTNQTLIIFQVVNLNKEKTRIELMEIK